MWPVLAAVGSRTSTEAAPAIVAQWQLALDAAERALRAAAFVLGTEESARRARRLADERREIAEALAQVGFTRRLPGKSPGMALVVHVRPEGKSWRVEGEQEMKLEQALGAKPKFAVPEYKQSPDDPKWIGVVFDNQGTVFALSRDEASEVVAKLDEFPDIKEALSNAAG